MESDKVYSLEGQMIGMKKNKPENPFRSFLKIGKLIARMNSDVDGYIELASIDVAQSKGKSTKDYTDYLRRL